VVLLIILHQTTHKNCFTKYKITVIHKLFRSTIFTCWCERHARTSKKTKGRFEKINPNKTIPSQLSLSICHEGLTSSFPTKLRFEKRNPNKTISSKLDCFIWISFYS